MYLDHRLRPVLKSLFLSAAILGAILVLGSTSASADACTDLGNCVVFEDECWCEKAPGESGNETCGYPAGFTGTYYSTNGLESADGCELEGDHMSFANPCPAVAGVADGARSVAILTALGVDPIPATCTPASCDGDCATNTSGNGGTSLACWDNHARWNRTLGGFVRCANVEAQVVLQEQLGTSDANLALCSGDLGMCSTDLSSASVALAAAEAALADADGDGVADSRDACADTAAGAEVDASGCDVTQFCSAFDASQKPGRKACVKADWQNDEPTQKKKERDCSIQKNGKGKADDTCVPAVL